MKLNVPSSRSGGIGDLVYVRNRQGVAVRARITPPNPRSNSQQTNRARFAAVTCAWRGLTDQQRALWQIYADQMPGHLAGFNAYMQLNTVRLTCGDAPFETPPLLPDFGNLTLTAFNAVHKFAAPHAFKLSLLATDTLDPDRYIVEATPPTSPGISNHGTTYRVILTPDNVADLAKLETAYMARFGNPRDGYAIALRITPIMNGRKSLASCIKTVVRRLTA